MSKPSRQFMVQLLHDFSIKLPDDFTLINQLGDLTNDTRQLNSNDVFCAVIGHVVDGRKYISAAINKGASLVLAECLDENEHGNIVFQQDVAVVNFYQLNKKLFTLASAYYQTPQAKMTMIGITGTNGKTSISQLLGQILTSFQKPCAIIGTNGAGMVNNLQTIENTTPSATDLVQLFNTFTKQKVTHLAMEVSSHALEQGRVNGNAFDIAVFTNLSRDHLDYHGSMADYAASKRQLFIHNNKQVAVLNGDDQQVKTWLKTWSDNKENLWLYGRTDVASNSTRFISCHNIEHHSQGVDFTLNTHLGDIDIHSPLLGDFNIDNLLAVIAVLLIEGLSLENIAQKITGIKAIAGRMEAFTEKASISTASEVPMAVVDYAHTPDALEKALLACRQHCHGSLHVVFGCGGDRDKGKRALMAQAAEKHADYLVITNDNPRSEAPMSIIDDILAGLTPQAQYKVIVDREQAVLATLNKANRDDVVLLAGKGHEDYIILGKEKVDYNERQIVMDFFKHVNATAASKSVGGQL
ncbi:MAG: UDP-N-acetylmuramoyl-L-alanyl-D-glutamate--2,6-diaminopimelate ligase [Colwellia sp.]|nr:UDP-N-acetylmuramoyl-L-alanyl-D-glutamate--2,6-diaminopimelate ligase [Colwellia sp.]